MFRQLRILFLLLILLLVATSVWLQRVYSTDWDAPLLVALYPINADGSERTAAYLDKLQGAQFQSIERFFDTERREYNVALERPVRFTLAPIVNEHPPALARIECGKLSGVCVFAGGQVRCARSPANTEHSVS